MNKMFSTKMTNSGGRTGEVFSPDRSLTLKIAPPAKHVQGATNPEQLFAAGFSSCFNSALELVLMNEKVQGPGTVSATVSLYQGDDYDYFIGVEIEGHIEGQPPGKTQELLEKAHQVCPYSKATRGNIQVTVKAV